MTPRPNALGYLILAGFAGSVVWLLTRKASAAQCPEITRERLQAFADAEEVSIGYFPEAIDPLTPILVPPDRIQFRESSNDVALRAPVIIVGRNVWWEYTIWQGEVRVREAPEFKSSYCEMMFDA